MQMKQSGYINPSKNVICMVATPNPRECTRNMYLET